MPKPTDGAPFSRKRPVWLFLGLIVLVLGAFVFKPIQNHFRIKNAVEEWNAHLPDWSTNLPDDGSGPSPIDPAKASQVPRTIDSDLTLTAAKSPWFLPADVTVERGSTLRVEAGADLVVLGTHGHGVMASVLLGSVAEGLVRKAEIPALVVPAPHRK